MKKVEIQTQNKNEFIHKSTTVIYELIQELSKNQPIINIALSGGNTPLPIYEKLKVFDLDWSRLRFYIVDERCVPVSDIENNYYNIYKVLFNHVPSISYPIIKEGYSYKEAAIQYEEEIRSQVKIVNGIPQFDLLILGMGLDGHTASLFPETEALKNEDDLIVLNNIPHLDTQRITMTYPLIMNSNKIVLLIEGKEKKMALEKALNNDLPISRIFPNIGYILN